MRPGGDFFSQVKDNVRFAKDAGNFYFPGDGIWISDEQELEGWLRIDGFDPDRASCA